MKKSLEEPLNQYREEFLEECWKESCEKFQKQSQEISMKEKKNKKTQKNSYRNFGKNPWKKIREDSIREFHEVSPIKFSGFESLQNPGVITEKTSEGIDGISAEIPIGVIEGIPEKVAR